MNQRAEDTEIVPAADITPTVPADPDDDHVLACAIAAGAELIVSGDAHRPNDGSC